MSSDKSGKTGLDEERPSATGPVDNQTTADSKAVEEPVSGVNEPEQSSAVERSEREKAFSRRALIQAGWAVPVILAVGLPKQVYAGTPFGFGDLGHFDLFFDLPFADHTDLTPPQLFCDHSDLFSSFCDRFT